MQINDLSPWLTYSLGLLFIVAMVLLVIGVTRAFALDRKIQAENDNAADKKVAEILEQIGWPSKPLFQVTASEIEYISLLLINPRMGRNKAWVRVRVSRTHTRATIEYWWDTDNIEHIWINMIARHFVKRGAQVVIRSADYQPRPEEIYLPDVSARSESNDPDPLSD